MPLQSPPPYRNTLVVRALAAIAALGAAGAANAAAHVDEALAQRLAAALPTETLEVVVTFEHAGPPTALDVAALRSLGITRGLTFRALPIAGALATPVQVEALAKRDDVASIVLNRRLEYYNAQSREISSVARAQANPRDFANRPLPYTGQGVAVMVNDSGIDATHADLAYGDHVVENVQGLTNLHALDAMLPVTWLEDQPTTDTNSGHGTHCAGTVGGSGERSGGLHKGVAPGADLVGYGSGAAIAILDSIGGFDYALLNQFEFASPIRVISNSWGTTGPFEPLDPVNVASYAAYKAGITVVFAAGNDGAGEDTHNPYAQAPWVISVGAGNKQGGLADFSSRGLRGETGTFTMPDGREWTYRNEISVVATGVDVISTRALTNVAANGATADVDFIAPEHLPFYTMISGTSMATPHVAGIAALLYEANPNLGPDDVKAILQRTATNLPGREAWEAGAGHVNAYAALTEATGLRRDFGATVNAYRSFHANAKLADGGTTQHTVEFLPVGTPESKTFTVGTKTIWVSARAEVPDNTVALVLIDPDGVQYGSGITLPQLGSTAAVSAPGKAGTWQVTVRGIGSVSGVAVDPLKLTNGIALPGSVTADVKLVDSDGYTGINDTANHPARGAIEYAVSRRLVDSTSNGAFKPDNNLTRAQLAEYLVMGAALRQQLPANGVAGFTDVAKTDRYYAFAEAASRRGGALKDLAHAQNGAIALVGTQFRPNDAVRRADLAYALVQSLGLQASAQAHTGAVSIVHEGRTIALDDSGAIPAAQRGHVQRALDLGLLGVRFTLTQGPFDLQPVLHAWFDPAKNVTRAEYAVAAARFLDDYVP